MDGRSTPSGQTAPAGYLGQRFWKQRPTKEGPQPPRAQGGDLVSTRVAKPEARAVLANGARKFTVGKAQKPTTTLSSLSQPKASA